MDLFKKTNGFYQNRAKNRRRRLPANSGEVGRRRAAVDDGGRRWGTAAVRGGDARRSVARRLEFGRGGGWDKRGDGLAL